MLQVTVTQQRHHSQFVYDVTAPTVTITVKDSGSNSITNGQYGTTGTYTVTLTASESLAATPTATCSGGICSTFSGSGDTWTSTFTPTDADESITIDVSAGQVTDIAGNQNTAAATQFAWTHDETHPTVSSFSMADTALKAGDTSAVSITFSEAVTAFTTADITVTTGTVSALSTSDSGTTWTATYTPAN